MFSTNSSGRDGDVLLDSMIGGGTGDVATFTFVGEVEGGGEVKSEEDGGEVTTDVGGGD